MNFPRKIESWQTSDGQLFEIADLARDHQKRIDLRDRVNEFWTRYGYSGMGDTTAADICLEHAEELREIFK